ncbi:hypothetical protein L596_018423 [Steinernema carpocapsae]|uniref:SH3 domain-containing protein n=1 Tax=Steinernema carpocapsae TaxID=34508 RepID=A0A4U5N5B2_STECR|nr:hypothetical protein L596_018423 [Steinernema carpocapsae]
MSVKKCAREECGKTVYPIEELKCLDKVWHKPCFKCTSCGMTLNMKNYKGYNKMPYCEAHYPKTVASVVADTPEMRRLAENTKLQSQVQYHAEYEKQKGKKTEIADDPETTRHLRNTQVQSQVAYHGEIAKKKAQDDARPAQLVEDPSAVASAILPPQLPTVAAPVTNSQQPKSPTPAASVPSNGAANTPYSSRLAGQSGTVIYSTDKGGRVTQPARGVGSIADYDPMNGNWGTIGASQASNKIQNMINTNTAKAPTGIAGIVGKTAGFTVKAIYDYTAADKDEVSFLENDIIVNCQKVDEGWMTGTVQRTLQWGMLPANYVERVKQQSGIHYLS